LNQWLVEDGSVFPDYYDSMSNEEILILQGKSKIASNAKKGIRSSYIAKLVPLDYYLVFEKGETDNNIYADEGLLNLPKFFRKQVDYEILKRCGLFRGDSPIYSYFNLSILL
jgi:hypothetical protein